MKKRAWPSLPEGCKPTKAILPDHVWQAPSCPQKMRSACLWYVRELNACYEESFQKEKVWKNFCCEACPYWEKYRYSNQVHGKKEEKLAKRKPKAKKVSAKKKPLKRKAAEKKEGEKDTLLQLPYQVHIDGLPALPPGDDLEQARKQARSLRRITLGEITVRDIRTGCEV